MKEVTVQELKQKIDNNESFQLIDVREPFEYEMSNIDGENIPLAGIVIESSKISKVRMPPHLKSWRKIPTGSWFQAKQLRQRSDKTVIFPPHTVHIYLNKPCCPGHSTRFKGLLSTL